MDSINKKKKFVKPEFTVMKIKVEGFCAASIKVKEAKFKNTDIVDWKNENEITGNDWN